MIAARDADGGVVFAVNAQPAGKRNAILGVRNGALRVSVTAAPEHGKANTAVIAVLAQALGVPKAAVTLLRGASASAKTIQVAGMSAAELAGRLRPWLAEDQA